MAFLVAAILGTLSLAVLVAPASEAQSTPPANCLPSGSQVVCTFGYTGAAQSWTVPEGVSQATFDVFGAPGGRVNGFGGFGGRVRATLTVTPGATYQILVGGERGFNGGGAPGDTDPAAGAGGAAGGGASDVRTGAYGLADRLLVAGGGGGAGTLVENPGGDGGHPNGGAGVAPPNLRGGGGTQTAGGAGAIGAGNGSLGQGGDGADSLDRGGGGGACGTNDRSGTINLTVSDPDGQAQPDSLKLGATSSNMALVPNANLTFGGSGASRTLTATAVSGKTGTATITVTVSDGTATGTPLALTLKAGGNSNDTLADTSGTNTTDILLGQNGDDTLRGVGGRDLLCGGRGNDRLSGGADADRFEGGSGTDTATDFNASQGDSRVGIP